MGKTAVRSEQVADGIGVDLAVDVFGLLAALLGGTGLAGSGTDNTKYLKSDGAGGWVLATPSGGGGGMLPHSVQSGDFTVPQYYQALSAVNFEVVNGDLIVDGIFVEVN